MIIMTASGPWDHASVPLAVALTLRFALELALLCGTAALAWNIAPGSWKWPSTVLSVVVVAVIWGLFLSPKATVTVPASAALLIEGILFIGIGSGLFALGHVVIATVGIAVWLADRIAIGLLRSRAEE